MAFMKEVFNQCRCGRQATHEVFNRRNASYGLFCKRCAAARVSELEREEKASDAAR